MQTKNLENLARYWNSIAGWYDMNLSKPNLKFYSAMIPFLDITPESTILETACGSGHGLKMLLKIASQSRVVGTDLTEGMLEIARGHLGDNVNLQIADNEDLKFEDNSFSHYISSLSLHIVPNPAKMLSEAYRVLKPGGQLAVSVVGEGSSFYRLKNLTKNLTSKSPPNPEAQSLMYLADKTKALRLIYEAGFKNEFYFTESYNFPIRSTKAALNWICTIPSVSKLNTTDTAYYQEVREKLLKEIEALMLTEFQPICFKADIYIARKPDNDREVV